MWNILFFPFQSKGTSFPSSLHYNKWEMLHSGMWTTRCLLFSFTRFPYAKRYTLCWVHHDRIFSLPNPTRVLYSQLYAPPKQAHLSYHNLLPLLLMLLITYWKGQRSHPECISSCKLWGQVSASLPFDALGGKSEEFGLCLNILEKHMSAASLTEHLMLSVSGLEFAESQKMIWNFWSSCTPLSPAAVSRSFMHWIAKPW